MSTNNHNTFLKMEPVEFDQDENGWRSLVGKTNEEDIGNLILEYIEVNHNKIDKYDKDEEEQNIFPISLLYFHAGQAFGHAGSQHYKRAVDCFKKSYEENKEPWNAYVSGTIAFLEDDLEEILRQINLINNSKTKNKRGGNIGILKNFAVCLENGICDYKKAYSMPTEKTT